MADPVTLMKISAISTLQRNPKKVLKLFENEDHHQRKPTHTYLTKEGLHICQSANNPFLTMTRH